MAYTGKPINTVTDEQMGVFSGYIRRPIPNQNGMIAQIFGENGDDADTILALSLSKYQDVQVFVNIHLVKDPNGRIMKQGDEYPLISSFVGFVRRSMPKKDGMIAQFFSPNGEHADSVSLLSKSEYLDCLVYVDVRGSLASQNPDKVKEENMAQIEQNYADKVTKQQKIEIGKKEKQFIKMNEQIHFSEFLYKVEVLSALGNGLEFKQWLEETQTCTYDGEKNCMNPCSSVVTIPELFKPFNYLPACELHSHEMLNSEHFEAHRNYYEMKHRFLTKQWAFGIMKAKFSFDGKSEPDPAKVIDWAASKNIKKYLPSKYQAVL